MPLAFDFANRAIVWEKWDYWFLVLPALQEQDHYKIKTSSDCQKK